MKFNLCIAVIYDKCLGRELPSSHCFPPLDEILTRYMYLGCTTFHLDSSDK